MLAPPQELCPHSPPPEPPGAATIPRFNAAGCNCQPYSSSGKRQQAGDPRVLPAIVWQTQRKVALEDFIGLENSPLYPIEQFSNFMSPSHQTISMVLSPEDFRVYCFRWFLQFGNTQESRCLRLLLSA